MNGDDMTESASEGHGRGVRRLIAELRQDLDDLRSRGRMERAVRLAEQTGEDIAADVLPMYFTGRFDADVVLIHLNPKLDPERARTTVPDLDTYRDDHARYGYHNWRMDPNYRSAFDHKQVRFLRPFGIIDFDSGNPSDDPRIDAERVIDEKLQLELVPYASGEFRTSRFTPESLAPHFERVLDVVTDRRREVVLFCGAVFDRLLDRSGLLLARQDRAFRLTKSDGSLTEGLYSFSNLLIDHHGTPVRAGLARQFAMHGLPVSEYGKRCAVLYHESFEQPPGSQIDETFSSERDDVEDLGVGDFRRSDQFLVLRLAVRALGENDSDEGSAIDRSVTRLARRYSIDEREVVQALNEGLDIEYQ
jgi:hypothetical protein